MKAIVAFKVSIESESDTAIKVTIESESDAAVGVRAYLFQCKAQLHFQAPLSLNLDR